MDGWFLADMDTVVPWQPLIELIELYSPRLDLKAAGPPILCPPPDVHQTKMGNQGY
jgi:hypothetical protein